MSNEQDLYGQLKPEVRALAEPLFELSEKALRERGSFLPHAAMLTAEGKIRVIGAMCNTPGGIAHSTYLLPLLRQGLRAMVQEHPAKVIGYAENVTMTPEGEAPTQAIKLHLEHNRGLTIALYLPFAKGTSGEITFGSTVSIFAPPEINAWDK